jgi:hypothetical protein
MATQFDVTNVTATVNAVTPTTVSVSWTAPSGYVVPGFGTTVNPTNYQVYITQQVTVGPLTSPQGLQTAQGSLQAVSGSQTAVPVTVTSSPATFTNLIPGATYTFYVVPNWGPPSSGFAPSSISGGATATVATANMIGQGAQSNAVTIPTSVGGGVTELAAFKTGIPFIVAPTGTASTNGAFTLGTALPWTVPQCYMYFGANSITSSNAAGWYYVIMSSTTAGVAYNNTYTSGIPTYPTIPVPFVSTAGTLTGVTTLVNGPTFTLAANTLGPNSALRIRQNIVCSNTANNKTATTTLGGTQVLSTGTYLGTGFGATVDVAIYTAGSQLIAYGPAVTGFSQGIVPYPTSAVVQYTLNFAQSQTLVTQLQLATATDFVGYVGILVEALP